MEDKDVRAALVRLLNRQETVPLLIDRLPDPEAVTLLKAWRHITFGPASVAEGADFAPSGATSSDTQSADQLPPAQRSQ